MEADVARWPASGTWELSLLFIIGYLLFIIPESHPVPCFLISRIGFDIRE